VKLSWGLKSAMNWCHEGYQDTRANRHIGKLLIDSKPIANGRRARLFPHLLVPVRRLR